jgi:tetratricopeptide (TPR) repeat protein
MLCNLGRFDEGLSENRKALEAEPFALSANFAYGLDLYKARRYDDAIKQFGVLFDLAPDYTDAHAFLFQTYSAKGDYTNAASAYIRQKLLDGEPKQELDRSQDAFSKGGWRAFVSERIRYNESNLTLKLDPNETACMYLLAGNKDKAIEWLNRAIEERGEGMTWLLVAERYDPLRDDPRFQEIVKRVGFAD